MMSTASAASQELLSLFHSHWFALFDEADAAVLSKRLPCAGADCASACRRAEATPAARKQSRQRHQIRPLNSRDEVKWFDNGINVPIDVAQSCCGIQRKDDCSASPAHASMTTSHTCVCAMLPKVYCKAVPTAAACAITADTAPPF